MLESKKDVNMAEESMEVKFEKKEMKRERKCKKLNKH